jgi:hypothetical protein
MAEYKSRPWSSEPSGKTQLPSSSHTGGLNASIKLITAGSNGLCNEISGAATAASMMAAETAAAQIVTLDCLKLNQMSLSKKRRKDSMSIILKPFGSSLIGIYP